MAKGKILVMASNATRIEIVGGGTGPTGQYLNETVVPMMAFVDAGYEPVLATPNGEKPFIDPASDGVQHFDDEAAYQRAKSFFADHPSTNQGLTLQAAIDEGLENYAAVFVPGGQAPVVDLMQDASAGEILRHFHEKGKPTALLCHGPIVVAAAIPRAAEFRAALIEGQLDRAAELAKGWQYAGYRMTVFSRSEEKPIEDNILHGKLRFYMPLALTLAGADVLRGEVDFEPYVIVDRELITGQNPRSDHPIAAKLIEVLDRAAGSD